MVALSTEILAPMLQFGCATACSGVIRPIASRGRVRKGPPEAVSTNFDTCSGASAGKTWKMAECSESTGISLPPLRLTRSIRAGPQQTRLSLLASARVAPVAAAAQAERRPAEPTMEAMTQSTGRVAASTMAAGPAAASTPVPARASRSSDSRAGSAVTAILGRQRRDCSARRAILAPPVRTST
ncbi:hypothetical protein D3C72_1651580 [compost metagenome]